MIENFLYPIYSRSGKSRRKAERRKWSLKEGSRNEDLALIEALHKAATNVEEHKSNKDEIFHVKKLEVTVYVLVITGSPLLNLHLSNIENVILCQAFSYFSIFL